MFNRVRTVTTDGSMGGSMKSFSAAKSATTAAPNPNNRALRVFITLAGEGKVEDMKALVNGGIDINQGTPCCRASGQHILTPTTTDYNISHHR
jgi:hypothetical protein